MGIVVIGAAFVDIKGFPLNNYIPDGRNVGRIEYIHGGVARNVVEDIANVELRPTYLGIVDDTPMGAAFIFSPFTVTPISISDAPTVMTRAYFPVFQTLILYFALSPVLINSA